MRGRRAWATDLPPIEQCCHSAAGRSAHRMAQPVALLLLTLSVASAEILAPPYFNLAQGKKVTATATCGDEGAELYCKLVGANADHDEHVIQGQVSAKRLFGSSIMCTMSNENQQNFYYIIVLTSNKRWYPFRQNIFCFVLFLTIRHLLFYLEIYLETVDINRGIRVIFKFIVLKYGFRDYVDCEKTYKTYFYINLAGTIIWLLRATSV